VSSRSILLSIIVPVHNNPRDLRECLTALVDQSPPDAEIIVVDDASTDETPSVAAALGARVFRLPSNSGPAAARNHGAQQARGHLLFFVDADVVVEHGAVDRVLKAFAGHPELAAVFGSYDATPRAPGIVSRYRNLLHHFVHQNGQANASTFWAGCGAIRRDVFHEVGGFDDRRFPQPSIEDIELGHRLHRAGHRILLDKTIQGTHLKRWTLGSLIRTDITRRAIPWSRFILENRAIPNALNLAWNERVSAVLVVMVGASLPLAVLRPGLTALTLAALAAFFLWNRKLYLFLWRQGGLGFMLACIPLHLLYFVYSGFSYLYAWLEHRFAGQPIARYPNAG
jgi:glycosyltransferase involved in cell wall biosynthesis